MSGSFALFVHSWVKEIELSLPFFHLSLEWVVLQIIETSTVLLKYKSHVPCTYQRYIIWLEELDHFMLPVFPGNKVTMCRNTVLCTHETVPRICLLNLWNSAYMYICINNECCRHNTSIAMLNIISDQDIKK